MDKPISPEQFESLVQKDFDETLRGIKDELQGIFEECNDPETTKYIMNTKEDLFGILKYSYLLYRHLKKGKLVLGEYKE